MVLGYWFFLDLTRLDCRNDGGSCLNSAGSPRGSEAVTPRGSYRATGGLVWSSFDCLTTRGECGGVFMDADIFRDMFGKFSEIPGVSLE